MRSGTKRIGIIVVEIVDLFSICVAMLPSPSEGLHAVESHNVLHAHDDGIRRLRRRRRDVCVDIHDVCNKRRHQPSTPLRRHVAMRGKENY